MHVRWLSPLSALVLSAGPALLDARPLALEENRGQADPRYRFVCHANGAFFGIAAAEMAVSLDGGPRLELELVGSRPSAAARALERGKGQSHYFLGHAPESWIVGVPHHGR